MKRSEEANPEMESRSVVARGWGEGQEEWGGTANGTGFLEGDENIWELDRSAGCTTL